MPNALESEAAVGSIQPAATTTAARTTPAPTMTSPSVSWRRCNAAASAVSGRAGCSPASPSTRPHIRYRISPRVIPTPAAPKPSCQLTFSPR